MFALPARIDYVTGAALDETRPTCSDINRDGACPGFRSNGPLILLLGTASLAFWAIVIRGLIRLAGYSL